MNSLFDAEQMDMPLEEKYPWMRTKNFVCVKEISLLDKIVEDARKSGKCVIDLETSGLDLRVIDGKPATFIAGFCLTADGNTGYYVPVNHGMEDEGQFIRSDTWNLDLEEVRPRIQTILDECVTIYHNASYDHAILENWGFKVRQGTDKKVTLAFPTQQKIDAPEIPWHDTYVLARLQDVTRRGNGLKELSKEFLGMEMIEIRDLFHDDQEIRFYLLDPNKKDTLYYGCSDAICTWHLFDRVKYVEQEQPIVYWMERRTIRTVREMAKNRIFVDRDLLLQKRAFLTNALARVEEQANELLGEPINLSSQKVVAKILTERYFLPLKEVDENGKETIHTDEESLSKYKDRCALVPLILKHRDIVKTIGTYVEKLLSNTDKDSTVKFDFKQLGTETGRFSCSGGDPETGFSGVNIQAMTKPAKKKKIKGMTDEQIMETYGSGYFLRSCFKARNGYKIAAIDYSGEELRVAANVSNEEVWIKSFNEGDGDLHTETAALVFNTRKVEPEQRDMAKCVDPSTLICVDGQITRIGSLSTVRTPDTFVDMTEGKKIFVGNENKRISQFYSNGKGKRLLVISRQGVIACSENHKFVLSDGTQKRASDLNKGDLLELANYPRGRSEDGKVNINPFLNGRMNTTFFAETNPDLAYVMGMFLGDGCSGKNGVSIATGGHGKYIEWQGEVAKSLEKVGFKTRVNPNRINSSGGTSGKVYFGSRHTISILHQLGMQTEDGKKNFLIPDHILNASTEVKFSFLAGLVDTDGTVSKKDGIISITTKSWEMCQDLCSLLGSLGIGFSVDPNFNKTYNRYYFRVHISKDANGQIRSRSRCSWKKALITDCNQSFQKKVKSNPVKMILNIEDGDLVDIEVDSEEHLYISNGFLTHNTLNFQTLYGGGPSAIAGATGCTKEKAKEYQMKMMGGLKNLQRWIDKVKKDVKKNKYCETPFGRRRSVDRFLQDLNNRAEVAAAERLATNTPIQGSGGDIMKLAMIKTQEYADQNNGEVRLLITVHDELVFEVLEEKMDVHLPNLMNIMSLSGILQGALKWRVPLSMDCEVGDSWDVDYEYFESKPEQIGKLIGSLKKMKARQFGLDPETLKPLAKEAPSQPSLPPEPEKPVEVEVDDLAPIVTTEQAGVSKALDVFKIATSGGIPDEDAMKQAIEAYLKIAPPKVYSEKGVKSLSSDELLTELTKIPLSWKPYSYTLNRVITKRDLAVLNMIIEESSGGNNESVILRPDGTVVLSKKLDAIRFDILARHYKL
jgi:DNA polymerase I-like protein with 3'-5' exonuclease and polymerase domains/intein/homing endonuclease